MLISLPLAISCLCQAAYLTLNIGYSTVWQQLLPKGLFVDRADPLSFLCPTMHAVGEVEFTTKHSWTIQCQQDDAPCVPGRDRMNSLGMLGGCWPLYLHCLLVWPKVLLLEALGSVEWVLSWFHSAAREHTEQCGQWLICSSPGQKPTLSKAEVRIHLPSA